MKTKLRKCIRRIIAFLSVFVIGFSAMSLNAFAADFIAGADYNNDGVHQDSELKSGDCDFRSLYGQNGSQYVTNLFWFYDPDNYSDYYPGLCIQTLNTTPSYNQGYKIYARVDRNDSRVIAYYYLLGAGVNSCNAKDYSFEQRVVIAHTVIAILSGDTTWNGNNAQHTWNLFGTEGSTWYSFIMDWVAWCKNSKIPDSMGAKGWLVSPEGEGTSGIQNMFIYDEWNRGWIKIQKSSSDTSITAGNNNYSLAGAVYGVYADAACTNKVDEITTDSSGWGECKDWHDYGTYYVKEITAPKGYKLDSTVYSATIDNSSGNTIYVSDAPYKGWVKLQKSSSNPVLSAGNSSYSLAGAVYGVYTDAACTNKVDEITTNSSGWGECKDWHGYGTYYVKEISAPKGFELDTMVYAQVINCETGNTVNVSDVPETDPVTIILRKVNKETGSVSNGAGTLKGAKYVIKYYDADMTTDPAASGKTLKYTYYAQTGADGRINLRNSDCYIGGDTLFKDNYGNVVFPLGTLTIQEYEAPEGYLLDNTSFVYNTYNQSYYVNGVKQTNATSYQEADSTVIHLEQEVKGKVSLTKKMTVIKDGGSYVKTAQKSSLTENVPEEGAEFQIYYKGAGSYDDATEAQRDILRTGADGKATSKDLPYGNYVIHQISGAANCTFMEDMEVSISENAKTYEVSATDVQKLNKLRLYKKGEVVTGYNKDTGFVYEERYIGGCSYQVYADEDCSDAGFIEQITSKDGGYAESAYEYKAGTYYIREAKAADGYMLDTTVYKIEVTTDGDNVVGFTDVVRTDSRQKVNVTAHKQDKEDSKPLAGAKFGVYATSDIKSCDGAVLVKKGDLIETMTTGENGAVSSAYDLPIGYVYEVREDYSPIGYGNAFETKKVNASKVLGYGDVPSQDFDMVFVDDKTIIVKTKAADYKTGDNQGSYDEGMSYKVIDSVYLDNLMPGKTYTINGKLMDRATEQPFLDASGNEVTGTATFKAESKEQVVKVEFNFKGNLEGKSTVVFEDLIEEGVTIYTHTDIKDENQTVDYPKIRTKAQDSKTKDHVGTIAATSSIIDTVIYSNLKVGNTYNVSGYLMDKDTGKPFLDANGNKITAEKTFTAETSDGSVDMTFTFDSSLLEDTTLVVFEDVFYNGVKVATHSDIGDEEQTIHYIRLRTTAKDTTTIVDATKRTDDTTPLQITDTVEYTNLIPGITYKVVGKLMDKVTGKPLADGKITSEVTFTAEEANGTVDVVFNFTRADLNSLNVVVFEDIYDAASNVLVATHSDINDEGQTVTFKSVVNIEKLDSTGIIKQLDGATLEILDSKGNVVYGPFVTTDKATEILGLLPDVEYILREVKAPAGFELANDVKFTLKDSARIQHVSMTDEAIIGYLNFSYNATNDWNKIGEIAADEESVKTSDSKTSMMTVYAVMMIVSALGMILVAIRKNKKGIVKLFGIFAVVMVAGLASVTTDTYAAESYKVTEKYTDKDAKKEYNFDNTVEKDGVTYRLSDVKYDAIEKKVPADVTKTLEMKSELTTYADAEFSETVEKDGITYKLTGVEKNVTGVAGRTQYHEESVNYNEVTGDKAISDTINTTVTDPVTGKDYEVTLSLVSKKVVKSASSDEFKFDITFYVTNGRYFRYKDNLVTYNENTPDVMQFSDEILSDLNLDPELYKINSIEWDGEAYTNKDGVLCRKAAAVGNRVINDYEVVYGGDYNLPADVNAYQWVGKYEATVNDPVGGTGYDITATATYTEYIAGQVEANEEKVKSSGFITFVKNHPATFAGVSVLIIAALVIVFLFFLRVRKSNKYPQE